MPLDRYVTLGHSGLRVSPFCLGAMTFGEDWGWGSSVADAESIVTSFIERGGNFIDTANAYTKGHSEKIIGDYVRQRAIRRDQLVIATKFFANLFPGDPNGGGANRKSIAAACDESLRRLQTDYIDLYWMHLWDRFTPIEETMRALDDLVTAGKVRYIGFSDTPAWKVAQAQVTANFRGWAPLIALQIGFLTQMCARFSPSRSAAPWEEGADALVPANQRCSRLSLSRRPPARAQLRRQPVPPQGAEALGRRTMKTWSSAEVLPLGRTLARPLAIPPSTVGRTFRELQFLSRYRRRSPAM